ncbi:DNA-3-methyladenine glycosylase I [Lacrimispora saccharolytica]|uniref:DNA-3-methyladenine glycosylase I n=1 Tax=Lacrimispora saccharolytica (strain ATCC 35040 / DSM 2544 / NRCC 2533 / WM1) TaxID=610130 RepID=D9R7G7_LACSW|nr:DNA-3-methyladenine glycosylase I [Lacrimispora saccharolytica]ADL03696.1 DNA-3-methyladenine glycosylase I [[Clostridium] saccharolyticum WM1]QRV18170.1 DNA-3-methyladenine glycosylase I [Lacrimispora saccharolytica]
MEMKRCFWVDESSPVYVKYHDEEWGVPVYDDKKLYEMFLLETFQAGLSWITILRKREAFREAFDGFDAEKVASYGEEKIRDLMENAGIIRNRRKMDAAVKNARVFLEIQREFGSFSEYLWGFTNNEILVNQDDCFQVKTELSDRVSKDMKKRGMAFVGSVTIYSYLQAVGVVNDHELSCFCRKNVRE